MFNARLAGGHLYGRQLFTWLSLVVSLMASFVQSFFPLDVLDEIWDLVGSVSNGFLPTNENIPNGILHRRYCSVNHQGKYKNESCHSCTRHIVKTCST